MREFVVGDDALVTLFARVNPHLDERQRRVLAGSVARGLGRGGIVAVAEATGMSRSTVQGAVAQIDAGIEVSDRVRAPGGGRPRLVDRPDVAGRFHGEWNYTCNGARLKSRPRKRLTTL